MGVYFIKDIDESAVVGLWEITETVDDLFSGVKLNSEEKELYDTFKNNLRKQQWLSYRNLLKEMISPEEYSHVIYDEFGKPYLQYNSYYLSVSHSGKFSAAIVSPHFPVGIDIEVTHPKIEKVTHKFLSEAEINKIGTKSRLEQLYVCWSAKESLYKLYGERNLLFQENIFLNPFEYNEKGAFTGEINAGKFRKEYTLHYEKLNDYMLVYTVAN